MNVYIFLSFGFLFFNHINFGMWKDSSLLSFQREAQEQIIEEKEIEKNEYRYALSLDNYQPDKNVAKWYKKYRFEKEIANQTVQNASFNFSKHSLKGQQAIIKYSNPELQTLLKVLQLSPEMQYPIIQHLFSGRKNELAVKKCYELTLANVCENLALAKEYNEKNNKLDMSEWFLLDPEQYETVHNILSCKDNKYTIESSQELTTIRSLPTNIKNDLSFIHCTRDYEWHEKINHIVQDITNSSPIIKYICPIVLMAEWSIAFGSLMDHEDFKKALLQGSFFGCSAGLGCSLSSLIYLPLKDICGKSPFWTIPISVSSGIVSYYSAFQQHNYLINKIALFSEKFSLGALLAFSSIAICDKYKPYEQKILKVKKFLDQI